MSAVRVHRLALTEICLWQRCAMPHSPGTQAGRLSTFFHKNTGAQVNLDQIDPENDDGEICFSI